MPRRPNSADPGRIEDEKLLANVAVGGLVADDVF
jgi:hypothetical protein